MASTKKFPEEAQQVNNVATILAIGTANPPNCIYQEDYPDFYFKVTKSEHMSDLKDKFKRICEKSKIKKRYFHLTEEILTEHPTICSYRGKSLNARQDILVPEVPKLAMEAAKKAIKEWGQPISTITHLIFYTTSGLDMPGADFRLAKLLGFNPSVKRLMLYNQGCYAGGTVLRVAKDITENNFGSRILVVCVETMVVSFHAPSATHIDILVGQAIFGDGAAAVIIGAEPSTAESPLFQLVSASQTLIPDSEDAIHGHLREMGLTYYLSEKIPNFIGNSIQKCLSEAFMPIGVKDWNSLFYAVHPGGPTILDQVEETLRLKAGKLEATRHVLSEYGNMWSPCVLFILDEMRKRSKIEGKTTTGEGLDWGVLVGFGPGLTMEMVVLHSVPIVPTH